MQRSALILIGLVASSTALAAPSLDVKDGVATVGVPRNYVEGAPTVQLTMEMPAGWKRWEETSTSGVMLVPETAKYGRPSITVNVQLDNLDPAKAAEDTAKKLKELKKIVVGGGKIKVLKAGKRPDGGWLSRAIDAKKERDIQHVETTCLVSRPGQPFVVQMLGFGETKDAGLVPMFEKLCGTIQIVSP